MGHSLEQVHREFSDDLWIHNGMLISLGIVFHFVVEFFNRFRHFFQPIAMQLFILGFNTFNKGGIWGTLRFWSNFVYRNRAWEMYKQIYLENNVCRFPKLNVKQLQTRLLPNPKKSLIAPSNLLPSSQRWTPLLPWRHQSFGDFHIWKKAQFWCCHPCNQNFCLPAYWRLNMSTLESDVQKAWFFDRPQQCCEKGRWMKPF